jgi:hypothetical protein
MRGHTPSRKKVSYRTKQADLFSPDSEQIKQHHLARLRELREEFKAKLKGE